MNLWRQALELARGEGGALATIARATGSTPVPAGAKMLVGPSGRIAGTVGGGCVEAEVIDGALAAASSGAPIFQTHHLNADLAGDLGLSCGGSVEIFVEPLVRHPAYLAALAQAAEAVAGVVTTATDWSAGPVKGFAPLAPGASELPAVELDPGRRFLIERFALPPRVIVFGAGHVGAAIARAAQAAGFRATVVDDRAEFADPARFPADVTVMQSDVEGALARVTLGAGDAVVIATRGHREDATILALIAPSAAGYVGLLGSRRKKAVITKALTSAGVSAEALARVRVPVGLDIGAVTPEEIAVSVAAELVKWRRGPAGR